MIPDRIIYTDGRDVTVTNSDLKVKNTMYNLNGIIKHGFLKLRANRIPGIILFILGGVLIKLGMMDSFPSSYDFRVGDMYVASNISAAWLGVGIALVGTILIIAVRERYAVCIATAEGEKNVIISNRKEYVTQIVEALNEAYRQLEFHFPFNLPDRNREVISKQA